MRDQGLSSLELSFIAADVGEAERYLEGQRETYGAFGVDSVVQASWLRGLGRHAFVLTAKTHQGQMVGGIRIHLRLRGTALPVESQLNHPPLNAFLEARWGEVPAELAGIWVSRSLAGTGVADFLFLGAMAAARSLGAGWACASAHRKGLSIWSKYGGTCDASVAYPYPDERYITYPMYIDLEWPVQPAHPARDLYRAMMRCLAAGRCYDFRPAVAQRWTPPAPTVVPWALAPAHAEQVLAHP